MSVKYSERGQPEPGQRFGTLSRSPVTVCRDRRHPIERSVPIALVSQGNSGYPRTTWHQSARHDEWSEQESVLSLREN